MDRPATVPSRKFTGVPRRGTTPLLFFVVKLLARYPPDRGSHDIWWRTSVLSPHIRCGNRLGVVVELHSLTAQTMKDHRTSITGALLLVVSETEDDFQRQASPWRHTLSRVKTSRFGVPLVSDVEVPRLPVVSDVEVDDVLGVGALHGDGERRRGVEGEGDEAARGGRRRAAELPRVDLELEQPRVARVEPGEE